MTHHSFENIRTGSIVVAKRILPSELVFLEEGAAAGIIVEEGGPGSHCSLLARALGIPNIVQASNITEQVATGDPLLLDGEDGTIILKPSSSTQKIFSAKLLKQQRKIRKAKSLANAPALTACGKEITVLANASNPRDVLTAAKNGAEGIGLYRIDGLYLRSSHLPNEDELFAELDPALAPFRGSPIVIRLLNAGGDKMIPALKMARKDNPFLGLRGVRLLLEHPELLASQLRAFLRLSKSHRLEILIPMISDPSDFTKVKQVLQTCATELGIKTLPPLGAMIETPAAALLTAEICEEADFLSIGSNDLTQNIMAAERGNSQVSRYYQDTHPAVLRMIAQVCQTAHQSKTPVTLCGSLAGNIESTFQLLDLGLESLSVTPPMIAAVKESIRACSLETS